jgi:hypothetical protein
MSFRKTNNLGRPSLTSDMASRQSEMQRDSSGDILNAEKSCSGLRNVLESCAMVRSLALLVLV